MFANCKFSMNTATAKIKTTFTVAQYVWLHILGLQFLDVGVATCPDAGDARQGRVYPFPFEQIRYHCRIFCRMGKLQCVWNQRGIVCFWPEPDRCIRTRKCRFPCDHSTKENRYTMAVRYETEQPYARVMSQSSSLHETLANTATASPQGRDFGRTSIWEFNRDRFYLRPQRFHERTGTGHHRRIQFYDWAAEKSRGRSTDLNGAVWQRERSSALPLLRPLAYKAGNHQQNNEKGGQPESGSHRLRADCSGFCALMKQT